MEKQQELILAESKQLAAPTPMDLLQIAMTQGADIDKLAKLMEMQLQWETNEALKAYNIAIATFKSNPPKIMKTKHVQYKEVDYWHATLDDATEAITKALSAVGMSHRWEVTQNPSISVSCILTHVLGHSEKTTLTGAPDATGSKNAIQAISSTVTYLQRYTLLLACGLAAEGMDDDGKSSEGMDEEWLVAKLDAIANCNSQELMPCFQAAYKEASEAKDKASQQALIQAKDARRKELNARH